MEIAYINERIDRKLRSSTTVFCATKEKIAEDLNKILANKGLKPVVGKVNIGFKVNYRHPKGMAASLFIPNDLPLPAMVGSIEVAQSKLISFLCSGGTRLFNVIRPDIL